MLAAGIGGSMSESLGHVRHGMGSVRPYIYGPLALWDMVREAFGAIEREREKMGSNAMHLEAQIGDSMLVLELGEPPPQGATVGSIYVYVPDVDHAYRLALEHGAASVAPPADKPYKERGAGVKDGFGNVWWIATYR
jgi:PhnB protein